MKLRRLTFVLLGILLLTACVSTEGTSELAQAEPEQAQPTVPASPPEPTALPAKTEASEPVEASMPFELTSTAFRQAEPIPEQYSCDGDDISPPLQWGDPPSGTQSFALVMDDPDAPVGTWDHWILFNIPADTRGLEENLPITGKNQESGSIFVGNNSWRRTDYGGPCPPGGTHRYFFKLYALDTNINLLPGANKKQVQEAMQGHILAETELMGTYTR